MAGLVVWTAVSDKTAAGRLARQIVNKRLAACVSVFPNVSSVYRWKGKIERAREHVLMIKTTAARWKNLQTFVLSQHPYEVPELISTPIRNASKKYLEWMESMVRH